MASGLSSEPWGYRKCGAFIYHPNNDQRLKKDSVLQLQIIVYFP